MKINKTSFVFSGLFVFMILISCNFVWAIDDDNFDKCKDILRDGIRDRIVTEDNLDSRVARHLKFCNKYAEANKKSEEFDKLATEFIKHEKQTANSTDVSGSYSPFSAAVAHNEQYRTMDDSQKLDYLKTKKTDIFNNSRSECGEDDILTSLKKEATASSLIANGEIVKAWRDCMLDGRSGITVEVRNSGNSNTYLLTVYYSGRGVDVTDLWLEYNTNEIETRFDELDELDELNDRNRASIRTTVNICSVNENRIGRISHDCHHGFLVTKRSIPSDASILVHAKAGAATYSFPVLIPARVPPPAPPPAPRPVPRPIAPAAVCPEGYILVPGNPAYETPTRGRSFCVMKYAASMDASNVPVSRQGSMPWVNITRRNAVNACLANGPGYHLITNAEWMTIARNIESNPLNWSGGAVGKGTLSVGNSHLDNPEVAAASMDTDPYFGTFHIGEWVYNRTHKLSNGEVIWDMGGNVFQWVSDHIVLPLGMGAYREYTDAIFVGSEIQALFGPAGQYKAPLSNIGIGKIITGTSGAVFRGGYTQADYSPNGIFNANLGNRIDNLNNNLGFRCVYQLPFESIKHDYAQSGASQEVELLHESTLSTSADFSEVVDFQQCGKWSEKYYIVPYHTWGNAPIEVQTLWDSPRNDCNHKMCQYWQGKYGVVPHNSWGNLPTSWGIKETNLRDVWRSEEMNCDHHV